MATTKRSNRNDDDRVGGEAPGTVDGPLSDPIADRTGERSDGQADEQRIPTGPDVPSPVQVTSGRTASGTTATLRLPFVTASFTRSSASPGVPNPVAAIAGIGQAAIDATASAVASAPRQKILFYTGVAALGVAGIVEWPVAALVATGTYVASKAQRRQTAPTRSA
jgi:hypothetical protein